MQGRNNKTFIVERHEVYVSVYVWNDSRGNLGAHYQALQYNSRGKLVAYNTPDGAFDDFQEFYEQADARVMLVIGYDRKESR